MTKYFHRAMAVALVVASVVFVVTPSRALAQNALGQGEAYPLSAAIEEVKQSPFHTRSEASALLFPQTQTGFSSSAWLTPPLTVDGTHSIGKLFLVSLVATTASDLAGLYLLACGVYAYDGGCGDRGPLALAVALPVSVVGGAVGAKLAGARFDRALFGSVAGVVAGVGAAALTGGLGDSLFLVVIPVVHAAVMTVTTASR